MIMVWKQVNINVGASKSESVLTVHTTACIGTEGRYWIYIVMSQIIQYGCIPWICLGIGNLVAFPLFMRCKNTKPKPDF